MSYMLNHRNANTNGTCPDNAATIRKRTVIQPVQNFNFKKSGHDRCSIHPYPAKFIGEIPRALMENFSPPRGTAILDPFCGSGTVLAEAQKKHIPSIGIDLNPIACLISEVSTTKIPKLAFETGRSCVKRARKNRNLIPKNNIPNVNHWFSKDVQVGLGSLKNEISKLNDPQIKKVLKFVLSSIIVRVSNQESDTRYVAVNKKSHPTDVFNHFLSSLRRLERLNPDRDFDTPVQVIQKDVLQTVPADLKWDVGMVITSPPYPNAYEYWLYHKYRMWWLDFDPLKVKEREIGARAHFFKKNPHNADTFRIQMKKLFVLLSGTLAKSGFACFVIGDSKIHGSIVDNSVVLEDVASSFDMDLHSKFTRKLDQSRKSFNLSYSRLKTEKIVVFKQR